MKFRGILFCGALFATAPAWAIPQYGTTTLPLEAALFTEANKEMVTFIPSVSVMQDTENPNHYYYTPRFSAVQNQTAGTALVNARQIARAEKIEATMSLLEDLQDSEPELKAVQLDLQNLILRRNTLKPEDVSSQKLIQDLIAQDEAEKASIIAQMATGNQSKGEGLRRLLFKRSRPGSVFEQRG